MPLTLGAKVDYAINPQRHKQCYRKAYAQLDSAVNQYLTQLGNGDTAVAYVDEITKALKNGEEAINLSYDA